MIIVISNPISIKDEALIIEQLFEAELEIFHVRKPDYSVSEMEIFLKGIHKDHHSKLALHQHHELAESFGIKRLHYTEEKRREMNKLPKYSDFILSTSIHAKEEYATVNGNFEYCFFSPVFDSISKPDLKSSINDKFKIPLFRKTQLLALGGIDISKIDEVKKMGFDGVAVLGIIWSDPKNAVKNFKEINKKWKS